MGVPAPHPYPAAGGLPKSPDGCQPRQRQTERGDVEEHHHFGNHRERATSLNAVVLASPSTSTDRSQSAPDTHIAHRDLSVMAQLRCAVAVGFDPTVVRKLALAQAQRHRAAPYQLLCLVVSHAGYPSWPPLIRLDRFRWMQSRPAFVDQPGARNTNAITQTSPAAGSSAGCGRSALTGLPGRPTTSPRAAAPNTSVRHQGNRGYRRSADRRPKEVAGMAAALGQPRLSRRRGSQRGAGPGPVAPGVMVKGFDRDGNPRRNFDRGLDDRSRRWYLDGGGGGGDGAHRHNHGGFWKSR